MAILVPRTAVPVEYLPEVVREPGTRDIGAANVVPKMIREALPIPGITSSITGPRLTTRTGTGEQTNINPLAGAALGALAANIISSRGRPGGSRPGPSGPGGPGTGGPSGPGPSGPGGGGPSGGTPGGGTPGGGTPGGGTPGGTRPGGGTPGGGVRPGGTPGGTPGYTGPVGIFTQHPDGSVTQVMDDGSTITTDPNGNVIFVEEAPEDNWVYDEESGTYYNEATGTTFDPETGSEVTPFPNDYPDYVTGGQGTDTPLYDYSQDTGGGYDFGGMYDIGGSYDIPTYDYSYDTGGGYDFGGVYDIGGSYDYPSYDYSYDIGDGFDFGGVYDIGGGSNFGDFGSYDFSGFDWPFKNGGMATPMMKKGGVIKMSNGGDANFEQDWQDVMGGNYTFDEIAAGDPVLGTGFNYTTDTPITTTSSDADAQEGGFYGSTDNIYTNRITGEVFRNGVKIYDPNVGLTGASMRFRNFLSNAGDTASGALNTIQNYIQQYPGTSGALAGALLSQVLSQSTGGGRENLGVDMTKYGAISPRTTTFGVGAPRFLTYEQYGSQQAMPELYGSELYRNLNAPGFNPVNPVPRQQPQAAGGNLPIPTGIAPVVVPGNPGFPDPQTGRMKRGGLAQMAEGGQAYYTYGKPVNPADNLMAQGGQPMMGGGAPMVQGRMDYRHGSAVEGPGDGQSDDIPAMLADGEYVIDAETVAMLGNGSNKAGAKKLDEFRMNIRSHKRDTPLDKIPPASKSPLAYLKGSKNG